MFRTAIGEIVEEYLIHMLYCFQVLALLEIVLIGATRHTAYDFIVKNSGLNKRLAIVIWLYNECVIFYFL